MKHKNNFLSGDNKKGWIFISVVVCMTSFAIPFLLKQKGETFNSTISLSFTAMGTMASLLTLIFAFIILDRHGVKGRYRQLQSDKIYELSDYLKKLTISLEIESNRGHYFLRPNVAELSRFFNSHEFEENKHKVVAVQLGAFSETFDFLTASINSDFLDEQMKNELQFLRVFSLSPVPNDDSYIKLFMLGTDNKSDWYVFDNRMTLESFCKGLNGLASAIHDRIEEYKS